MLHFLLLLHLSVSAWFYLYPRTIKFSTLKRFVDWNLIPSSGKKPNHLGPIHIVLISLFLPEDGGRVWTPKRCFEQKTGLQTMSKKPIIVLTCHLQEDFDITYITSASQFLLPHTHPIIPTSLQGLTLHCVIISSLSASAYWTRIMNPVSLPDTKWTTPNIQN
jgi:hypothetical protein